MWRPTHAVVVLHHSALHVKTQVGRALGVGEVGAGQVGAAAQQFGQLGGEGFERKLAGLAAGHGFALGVGLHHSIHSHLGKVAGRSPFMRRVNSAASSGKAAL
jgi:hypothetical protein